MGFNFEGIPVCYNTNRPFEDTAVSNNRYGRLDLLEQYYILTIDLEKQSSNQGINHVNSFLRQNL